MKIINSISEMKRWRKSKEGNVGFVPTMGGLHDGHFSLIKRSIEENNTTVASIFLNPTQFNSSSDLENYPANLDEDLQGLEKLGVDVVLTPTFGEIYPDNYRFKLTENEVSKELCGAHRPGHFDGVLTIVLKLFNIVTPTRAYFGEKDYQQLQLIKDMTEALFLETRIVSVPTVRESDGLAMSSRNRRLNENSRLKASELFEAISNSTSSEEARRKLASSGFDVDYVVDKWDRRFVAATIDGVRLIDNAPIPHGSSI